ncbi:uncharacterized protein [Typha angustifolia]|uniref:uncharacterized protein isoform X2 n=1 Tax=Typha angustifolia TaxID=59011 RepID=UPI003C2B4809
MPKDSHGASPANGVRMFPDLPIGKPWLISTWTVRLQDGDFTSHDEGYKCCSEGGHWSVSLGSPYTSVAILEQEYKSDISSLLVGLSTMGSLAVYNPLTEEEKKELEISFRHKC